MQLHAVVETEAPEPELGQVELSTYLRYPERTLAAYRAGQRVEIVQDGRVHLILDPRPLSELLDGA